MIHGKKTSFKGSLYFKKPHYCPKCQTQMQTVVCKEIVNSKSSQDTQHDFRLTHDTHLAGNIEVSWKELKCPNCSKQLTMEEMQKIESESLSYEQSVKQERIEKLKVAAFTFGLVVIALVLLVLMLNR